MSASQVSALFTVDVGCICQDIKETGWGLVREIKNSILGKFEVTMEHEVKVSH